MWQIYAVIRIVWKARQKDIFVANHCLSSGYFNMIFQDGQDGQITVINRNGK